MQRPNVSSTLHTTLVCWHWVACCCQWVSVMPYNCWSSAIRTYLRSSFQENEIPKQESLPSSLWASLAGLLLHMLPRVFPPTSSETYNVFTKNSNLVLASPFCINGEALSPFLRCCCSEVGASVNVPCVAWGSILRWPWDLLILVLTFRQLWLCRPC